MHTAVAQHSELHGRHTDLFGGLKPNLFIFIVILGALTAALCYLQDLLISRILLFKILVGHDDSINYWLRYAGWIIFNLSCVLISACVGEYLSRDSEGSGLPEMKAILAGVHLSNFLGVKALIGKFVGVTLAIGGGLSFGRYGAFVHNSAIIAHQMAFKIKSFHSIGSNYQLKLQMYQAAIAAGTCCAAGCPFGGVIFALELTSTFYMVGNLWKSLLCTVSAILVYTLCHELPWLKPPAYTQFPEYELNHELIFMVILGVISARVGAMFIHILTKIIFLKAKLKNPLLLHRWKWCILVSLFISFIQFPIKFLHFPERQVWNVMFSTQQVPTVHNGNFWIDPSLEMDLIVYCILKFIFIVLSLTLPLPNGIFAPVISFGAVFGRLYGHMLFVIGDLLGYQLIQYEGIYAVIGAASVYGSVTKTVSIAIIIFEVTGQITLLIPIMVGVMVAYFTTSTMAMSIFDVLLEFKNFPFLPTLGSENSYNLRAKDIMTKNYISLNENSTLQEIAIILQKLGDKNITIPVINEKGLLLFTVQTKTLKHYLEERGRVVKFMLDFKFEREVKEYTSNLFKQESTQLPYWLFDPTKNIFYDTDILMSLKSEAKDEFNQAKLDIVQSFWQTPIDFEDPLLIVNKSPTIITEEAPFSKIHFLFIMLNINTLLIVKSGKLKGLINKIEFIKKRRVDINTNMILKLDRKLVKEEYMTQQKFLDFQKFFQ